MTKPYSKVFLHAEQKGKVSIIIPVYKDAVGLRDTLRSLNQQTFPKKKIEVLVANDGGDLRIRKICKLFKVTEVTVIPQRGSYHARNIAISISSGEFILFTDADVQLPPNWVKCYVNKLKHSYDYCGGNVVVPITSESTLTEIVDSAVSFPIEEIFKSLHFFPTVNLAVTRKVFEDLGYFDNRLISGGDLEFGTRVYRSSSYKQGFVYNVVTHPPRRFGALFRKLKRMSHGQRVLYLLYPEYFPKFKKTPILEIRSALSIPKTSISCSNKIKLVQITALMIFFQLIKAFYNIYFLTIISNATDIKEKIFLNTEQIY